MSEDLQRPVTPEELEELEDFLLSDKTSENSMTLDMLDGYLTSVVIGPQPLMPEEWMPYVWGLDDDPDPEFESEKEAERIIGILLRYSNTIADVFVADPDSWLPLFEQCSYPEEEDRMIAIESWAYAFVLGIELVSDEWKPMFEDDDASGLMLPIFILGRIDDNLEVAAEDELDEWVDALPEAVSGIYEYWLSRRYKNA